jgi:hypothetical protein
VTFPLGASSWYEYFRPSIIHTPGSVATIQVPTESSVCRTYHVLPLCGPFGAL